MSDVSDASESPERNPTPIGGRRALAHVLITALLGLEAALLAAAAMFLLYELLVDVPTSYASAVAILVIVALAAIWLAVVAVGMWRGASWTRGAALFWQLVQIAIAIGSFQGVFARADIGWFLLVPAVLVIVLLFARSVMLATARRE